MGGKKSLQMQKRSPSNMGKGVGLGHGGNSNNLPAIKSAEWIENDPQMIQWKLAGLIQVGTKCYVMGQVKIYVSPPTNSIGWHMSISHPKRYPTWDEIAKARYTLLPDDIEVVMHLPSRGDYINLHNFCFQLHELKTD